MSASVQAATQGKSGLFSRFFEFTDKFLNPPRHIRVSEMSDSLDGCLRSLEKSAGLPTGDLYLKSSPMEVTSFPLKRKGLKYFLGSKTSDTWADDPSQKGYVAGSVIEFTEKTKLDSEQRKRFGYLMAGLIAVADSSPYFGSLHMSKNCPGVYENNMCKNCGDVARS